MEPLNLTAPKSWDELSQDQLDFLLRTIAKVNRVNINRPFRSIDDFSAQTAAQVAVYCLFRWNGVRVITPYSDSWLVAHDGKEYLIRASDLAAATAALEWVAELPSGPVRLDHIDKAEAVDAELDDSFTFDDWLSCEALWQGYQVVKSDKFLQQMAEVLYRKPGIKLAEHETLSIFYWWAGLKAYCNQLYPNFFQPADPNTAVEPDRDMLRRNMDAQIRALTKGDISKESLILAMPAHRALTELDALAKEYDDLNRKYPTK